MSDLEQVTKRNESVDSLPAAPEGSQPNDPASPPVPRRFFGRASSRVTVGYFDRAGVDHLRRTLTHLSEDRDPENAQALSSETLSVPATGHLDLQRTLQNIVKKYVVPTTSIIRH